MPPQDEKQNTTTSIAISREIVLVVFIIAVAQLFVVASSVPCVVRSGARSSSRYVSARRLYATGHSSTARKRRVASPGHLESSGETKACRSGGLRRWLSRCFPVFRRRSISRPSVVVRYRRRR